MLIEDKKIELRLATEEDAQQIFVWRNHENTRRYFFNTQSIVWEDHVAWFDKVLQDLHRHLLIAYCGELLLGVMRLDCEKDTAEVDIYLAPDQVGKGWGTTMLRALADWAKKNLPHLNKLVAKVVMENQASLRAFEKAGFMPSYQMFEKALHEKN